MILLYLNKPYKFIKYIFANYFYAIRIIDLIILSYIINLCNLYFLIENLFQFSEIYHKKIKFNVLTLDSFKCNGNQHRISRNFS